MKKKMVALLLAVMVTSTSLMQVPVVAHAEENQTEVCLLYTSPFITIRITFIFMWRLWSHTQPDK